MENKDFDPSKDKALFQVGGIIDLADGHLHLGNVTLWKDDNGEEFVTIALDEPQAPNSKPTPTIRTSPLNTE
jgi:hypothetical protein